MSKLDTASYKGVRDFYPEDQFIQNYIFKVWRKVLERYGYEEYGASILEPADLYKAKSGDEIVNEQTYTFIDRGDREVTLRPEMTPTVARMVAAKRRELGFPLRWYSIPNLFRYEAPQRGRLREHWQLNADIFGVKGVEADIEIIVIAYEIMKAFGAKDEDFEIQINDRSLIENHLRNQGVSEENINAARQLIDKKKKIPNFEEEMKKLVGKDIDLVMFPTERINQILTGLEFSGIKNARFESTLVRGFDYYSGMVFEVFDTDETNSRSMFGGGRYDNLTSMFSEDAVPGVGFGSGDVVLKDFLETHNLLPEKRSRTDLFLCLKDIDVESVVAFHKLAASLRDAGLNVATDQSGKEKGDLYKVAEKHNTPFIGFVESDKVVVKNMATREELETNFDEAETIKNFTK
ncbi:MAG: hisS [Parcubacteria group bacterium]|nr:hisS [Parcubacteria group bacterium]